jgi:hypothetical protein
MKLFTEERPALLPQVGVTPVGMRCTGVGEEGDALRLSATAFRRHARKINVLPIGTRPASRYGFAAWSPSMNLHRRLLYGVAGLALLPVGVAGVVVPLLPGIPILVLAVACIVVAMQSGASAGSGLGAFDRVRVELLLGLRTVLDRLHQWTTGR